MNALFLLIAVSQAAKPSICTDDLSTYELPTRRGSMTKPANFTEGAVRPGFVRFRDDMCRCLPWRKRKWPALIKADLWVQPNQGTIKISYAIDEERNQHVDRMLECMGEPNFNVEPMPYTSDMVYTDGRKAVFPRYPIWLYLKEGPDSKVP